MIATDKFPLYPPPLSELADILRPALQENYNNVVVEVVPCPNLRQAPFYLTTEGLTGDERIGDVGGQPNLFPIPRHDRNFSLSGLAEEWRCLKARAA